MTKEQIKEKAKDFVSKIAGGTSKEMDYYANILAEFATEVTKELEKEKAELKEKLEKETAHRIRNFNKAIEWKEKYRASQKENAELKEYNKYLKRKRQGGIQKQYNKVAIIKQQDEQLTNAKEIIREFVEWANWQGNSKCPSFKSIQDKAEQFLKESE